MKVKNFDVIVIGAGSGLVISSMASQLGLKVAVIEKERFGGTCLNVGCIPSKILIHSADVAETIKNSEKFGIKTSGIKIDWNKIQNRVWKEIDKSSRNIELGNKSSKNITVFKNKAKFVDKKILKVGNEYIKSDKIFICAGTRPLVPMIEGLDKVDYIDSSGALRIKKQPKHLIIIGGGYIATELAHFYSSLGTKVSMVVRSKMISHEDEDVIKVFTQEAKKRYKVYLKTDVKKVSKNGKNIVVETSKGKISGDKLLIATGRVSNSDLLNLGKTNIKTDKRGFIMTDDFMETNVKGIYAIGDIAGKYQFKHSANLEAEYAALNGLTKHKHKVDYKAMPHAIFSSPQIAGVGYTEQELISKKIKYFVGKYKYINSGMGKAFEDTTGFVKVLVDKNNKILGCHILGSEASTLIHEVILAMKYDIKANEISNMVHIHPALSEVIQRAFSSIEY